MCGSMVDIQSPTAEIRRGKKERKIEETTGKNIMSTSATQGGHNNTCEWQLFISSMLFLPHKMANNNSEVLEYNIKLHKLLASPVRISVTTIRYTVKTNHAPMERHLLYQSLVLICRHYSKQVVLVHHHATPSYCTFHMKKTVIVTYIYSA